MNWDDPTARAALVERVGPAEYERLQAEHMQASIIETVNGRAIRAVTSERFGRLYLVDGLNEASQTIEGARAIAANKG